ncbi:DHS-like NAD/FAD-binding domain-containing protein [Fimicolochytrium jonesii]|uniref:DHS-like NAD/FAD-binding domain-containing protein n=1 Tax=Fimicolochytrium jonesii TaxID=1396493 RepID=UPI0022FEE8BD|nr:DHS-like NAD/FAD-binding domain-containing protein [Fimicolochytrium jonesii]KAI8820785.1 DHS-like NAD/FAD-binding domain-containing protein [Fimicolochytrium jonesii]
MEKEKNPSLNIIPEPTLRAIAEHIKTKGVKKILVLTGAGISTSAGIPDFRSPGTGLYDNLKRYNLPYPEAIFDIKYFRRKPEPFFTLARELYPGFFRPTICHYFVRLLQDKDVLLRNYTQNIDTLERIAGIKPDKLLEAHGSFAEAHCRGKASFSQDEVKRCVFAGEIPRCDVCDGLIKPDIVFFGESLPARFHDLIPTDFTECDLAIVIGTSLQVAPFSNLINILPETVPRLLINREVVGVDPFSTRLGFDFVGDRHQYRRDAVFLGSCDDGCEELADLLGWGEDLRKLMEEKADLVKVEKVEDAEHLSKDLAGAIAETMGGGPVAAKEEDNVDELVEGMQNLLKKAQM